MPKPRIIKPPSKLNEAEFREYNEIQDRLETLAANVRYIGHESGWTRADLADRMGTSTGTIARLYLDADDVPVERLATFALACGYRLRMTFEPNPDASHPERRMGPSRRVPWEERPPVSWEGEPPVDIKAPKRQNPKHRWST